MPKIEGRESTRHTIDWDKVEGVDTFVGVWDASVFKRVCGITGCDHVISGVKVDRMYETCGEGSGAGWVHDGSVPEEKINRASFVAICVCHVDKLLDMEQP